MGMQDGAGGGFRLSPQQEELWRESQGRGRSVVRLTVRGTIDAARFETSLRAVVARHEILRTGFARQIGMKLPLQVIAPDAAIDLSVIDVATLDPAARRQRADDVFAAACRDRDAAAPDVAASLLVGAEQSEIVLSLNALCGDTATLDLLAGEIAAHYAGLPFEAQEPVQYADYAEWQRELLESQDPGAREGREHWEQIVQRRGRANLPMGIGESRGGFEPATLAIDIPSETRAAVTKLAETRGASAAQFFLGAWACLLARLSGESHVTLRRVVDGRTSPELATAMGPYAKALPFVVEADDEPFADVLQIVAAATAEGDRWQDYFGCATEWQNPIDFEWRGGRGSLAGDWLVADRFTGRRVTLALACNADRSTASASLWYDASVLRAADVERIAKSFVAILESAGDGTVRTGALRLAGSGDARGAGTGPAAPFATWTEWFAAQVAATPDSLAVVGTDTSLSYAQLAARADAVAESLRGAGVKPGAAVGVCGDRSSALLAAVIGVMRAGAAFVPVSPEQPAGRVADQLKEVAAQAVLVTDDRARAAVAEFSGPVLGVAETSTSAAAPAASASDATSRAYVLYTSGSTGRPKGVEVQHRNLVAYSAAIIDRWEAAGLKRPGLQCATVSALTADLGYTCIFPTLVMGGCVHMVPPSATLDPAALGDYMQRHAVDVLKITPSHLAAVLDDNGDVLPRALLISGGEALPWTLVDTIQARGRCAVWNHYGPTETTVGALVYPIPAESASRPHTRTVPIGTPLGAATVAVVDAAGSVVPIGVPGELWIGGPGVTAGYAGQPALTEQRFVAPAWAGSRMYRTGDRVWMQPDGSIEFVGRVDDQVKIRGYRVEPGEVEHVVLGQAGVREAAVVAVGDTPADRRLVAYVVGGAGFDSAALLTSLRARLPEYMLPAIVPVASLPRLANGKVDRRELARREATPVQASVAVAPRTPVEAKLVEIWQTLLGCSPIGIHDNFFELGGHSLLATQLIAQVRRAFDVNVPLHAIFDGPSIASLAEAVSGLMADAGSDPEVERLLASVEGLSPEELQALLDTDRADV
ncbi:MAG TPA: amino acid adenylation domain-containing protein [Vicinamibacterales bacterium]|nr:amino acid adenylation domain-containing protein [Vicinamibacterales bacterium]